MNTALVIGATGLVGSSLVDQLLQSSEFDQVVIFTRRPFAKTNPKLIEHVIDFDKRNEWENKVKGSVLFSALGTTLKKAGSKEAQYKIDFTYQYQVAQSAAQNGVAQYVLVSAAYASPNSRIFYSRMKGELDRDVKKLPFQNISILQPGMLAGNRIEKRSGEGFGIAFANFVGAIPGLSYLKPVHASIVAQAMIKATHYHPQKINIYRFKDINRLAERDSEKF